MRCAPGHPPHATPASPARWPSAFLPVGVHRQLISNQRNYQCITQCKAFEEVVDTQMYGFSKQVDYAQKLGILTKEEGSKLIVELEKELNQVYVNVYDEQKKKDFSNERK